MEDCLEDCLASRASTHPPAAQAGFLVGDEEDEEEAGGVVRQLLQNAGRAARLGMADQDEVRWPWVPCLLVLGIILNVSLLGSRGQ